LARFKSKLIEISPPNRFYSEKISVQKKHQKNNLICGFVGRFVLEKGISKIIEAAHLLNNQPVEFWLAGDYKEVAGGSIYSDIKTDIDLLGTKVRLLGRLTDNELKNFYRTIDVLLLPSTNRFEAFGMVQMEAMTFGAIVVTSNMPGVRETVRKTGIGQLCKPNSGQSLADAIMRAAKDRLHFTRSDVSNAVRFSFTNKNFEEAYMNLLYQITFDR
jgi:glycosyltransferase involved in cell wall biosynthesis